MTVYMTNTRHYEGIEIDIAKAAAITGVDVGYTPSPVPFDASDSAHLDEDGNAVYNPANCADMGSIWTNSIDRDHGPFWDEFRRRRSNRNA